MPWEHQVVGSNPTTPTTLYVIEEGDTMLRRLRLLRTQVEDFICYNTKFHSCLIITSLIIILSIIFVPWLTGWFYLFIHT